MIRYKNGVSLRGVQPQVALAITSAKDLWALLFSKDLWVTSVNDGKHSRGSLHYKGLAFDVRTRDLSKLDQEIAVLRLREVLGAEFDVVLEKDHIHIEFDPD